MRALILAAGLGSRMGALTASRPKCMLPFRGRPLLLWQAAALKKAGIAEVGVVTGHCGGCVPSEGVRLFRNPDYASSNMVASMMRAEEWFDAPLVVAYADLLYEPRLVTGVLPGPDEVRVAADADWRPLWLSRYGTTESDLETFAVDEGGRVTDLGRAVASSAGIDLRYVGLVGFSAGALRRLRELYVQKSLTGEHWRQSGNSFAQGYMTDALYELNAQGTPVMASPSRAGWFEVDSGSDYELLLRLDREGGLGKHVAVEGLA